jgi:hypothetical protein
MPESIAELLEQAGNLPTNSAARNRLEDRVLEESQITNMNQLATLVEAIARRAALENGAYGDQDTAEELFASSLTISESLRMMHELIQTLA